MFNEYSKLPIINYLRTLDWLNHDLKGRLTVQNIIYINDQHGFFGGSAPCGDSPQLSFPLFLTSTLMNDIK